MLPYGNFRLSTSRCRGGFYIRPSSNNKNTRTICKGSTGIFYAIVSVATKPDSNTSAINAL